MRFAPEAVIATGALAVLGILLALPALARVRERGDRTRCVRRLRLVALAAITYADDRRFYPHVGPIRRLDGDAGTSDAPRALRGLVWGSYLDEPDAFVCPASGDAAAPRAPAAARDAGRWTWGGRVKSDPGTSPITDAVRDPVLIHTRELSYGWVRRGLNAGARGTTLLAADRVACARGDPWAGAGLLAGNHAGGWNVAQVDGAVEWRPVWAGTFPGAYLAKTDDPARDGFLAVVDQDDPAPLR